MKIKNIGIPRYLYYSKYKTFIKNYFEYLGYNVIVSSKYPVPYKNYLRCNIYNTYISHINNLKEKCDFIIIPYQRQNTKKETICPILENMNTIMSTQVNNIFTFNLYYPRSIIFQTLKITKNLPKIIVSYILSRIDYNKEKKSKIRIQQELINNNHPKILIVSSPYINIPINTNLNDKYNILYSYYISPKKALDYYILHHQKTNIYFIQIMLGSIYYLHNIVKKIIVVNPLKCKYHINNYINYMPYKIKKKIIILNI